MKTILFVLLFLSAIPVIPQTGYYPNNSFDKGVIDIVEPKSNYYLRRTETFKIKWETQTADTFSLYYRINPSENWNIIAEEITERTYDWLVPNTPSSACQLKITDKKDPSVFDTVNNIRISQVPPSAPFDTTRKEKLYYTASDIHRPTLKYKVRQLVNQSGVDSWTMNVKEVFSDFSISEFTETWRIVNGKLSSPQSIGYDWMDLQQRRDTSWNLGISIGSHRIYEDMQLNELKETHDRQHWWSYMDLILNNKRRFIVGVGPAYYLFSEVQDFINETQRIEEILISSVTPQHGRIVIPNGGEVFRPGFAAIVYWQGQTTLGILPQFSSDGGNSWTNISPPQPPGITSFYWTVPSINSNQCLIRLMTGDGEYLDTSDSYFSIKPLKNIEIEEPRSGYYLRPTEKFFIKWAGEEYYNYSVFYRYNYSPVWIPLQENINGTSFLWSIPETPSENCILKVSYYPDTTRSSTISGLRISSVHPSAPFDTTLRENIYYRVSDTREPALRFKIRKLESQTDSVNWQVRVTNIYADNTTTNTIEHWTAGEGLLNTVNNLLPWMDLSQRKDTSWDSETDKGSFIICDSIYFDAAREIHIRERTWKVSDQQYEERRKFVVGCGPVYMYSRLSSGTEVYSAEERQVNEISGISGESNFPAEFKVYQNYPNPFNSSTIIRYSIAENSTQVSVKLFDLLGREIAEIFNGQKDIGMHLLLFDASEYNLTSGVYFYQIRTKVNNSMLKMIYLK